MNSIYFFEFHRFYDLHWICINHLDFLVGGNGMLLEHTRMADSQARDTRSRANSLREEYHHPDARVYCKFMSRSLCRHASTASTGTRPQTSAAEATTTPRQPHASKRPPESG